MFKVENENSLEKIYQIGFNIREIEATHVPSSSFIPTMQESVHVLKNGFLRFKVTLAYNP
jgi:hypothetical protein